MKNFVLLGVLLLCVSSTDSRYSEEYNFSHITSLEMSVVIGGCGSGTCTSYTPSCPAGCTKMGASNCKGSAGSCVHDHIIITCDCPGEFIIDNGCM